MSLGRYVTPVVNTAGSRARGETVVKGQRAQSDEFSLDHLFFEPHKMDAAAGAARNDTTEPYERATLHG